MVSVKVKRGTYFLDHAIGEFLWSTLSEVGSSTVSPSFFKPKQTMMRAPADTVIGELLVAASIISQNKLDECVRLAGNKRLSLGQMLIMSGYLTSKELDSALDAQGMVKDGVLDMQFASRCLKIAHKSGSNFFDVVNEQKSLEQAKHSNDNRTLAQLLIDSDTVSQNEIAPIISRNQATGIPVGRSLVVNGIISEKLLAKALDLMVKWRDEVIDREEAIEALRAFADASGGTPMTQAYLLPPSGKKIRLGELMKRAGLMSEADVLNAVEFGLAESAPIGQVIVAQGYAAEYLVDAALELQDLVEKNVMEVDGAIDILHKVYSEGRQVSDFLADLTIPPQTSEFEKVSLSFEKLLVIARVVSAEQIDQAFEICRATPEALTKILTLTGFIDQIAHDAVLRCNQLISENRISQDDALVALDYCFNSGGKKVTFDEALADLGWTESGAAQLQQQKSEESPETDFDPNKTDDQIPTLSIAESLTHTHQEETVPPATVEEQTSSTTSGAFAKIFAEPEPEPVSIPEPEPEAASIPEPVPAAESPVAPEPEPVVDPEPEPVFAPEPEPVQMQAVEPLPETSSATLAVPQTTQEVKDDDEEGGWATESDTASRQTSRALTDSGDWSIPANNITPQEQLGSQGGHSSNNGNGIKPHTPDLSQLNPMQPAQAPAPQTPPLVPTAMAQTLDPNQQLQNARAALKGQDLTIMPKGLKLDQTVADTNTDAGADESAKKAAATAAMYRLAESYFESGEYGEAQKVYEKILAIKQTELGSQHLELVSDLNKLAEVLWTQGHFKQAEPFVRRAVTILESTHPVDMLRLAEGLRTLAGLYFQQGKYDPCLPLLDYALMLKRQELGEEHVDVAGILKEYSKILKKMGRKEDAERFMAQAKAILAKQKPSDS